jgi:hypothetical protein
LPEWLLGDARSIEETTVLVAELGERLNAAGIDVRRITTGVPILHPQVASYSALWNRGAAVTERVYQLDPEAMAALRDARPHRLGVRRIHCGRQRHLRACRHLRSQRHRSSAAGVRTSAQVTGRCPERRGKRVLQRPSP